MSAEDYLDLLSVGDKWLAKCGHTFDQHSEYGCTVDYPAPCWCGTERRRLVPPWNLECAP